MKEGREDSNFRGSFQCSKEAEFALTKVLEALKVFDEYLVFSTGIRANNREPYSDGGHVSLFFRFPSETEEGSID